MNKRSESQSPGCCLLITSNLTVPITASGEKQRRVSSFRKAADVLSLPNRQYISTPSLKFRPETVTSSPPRREPEDGNIPVTRNGKTTDTYKFVSIQSTRLLLISTRTFPIS